MKKTLLLLTGAIMSCSMAIAQTESGLNTPAVYPDMKVVSISPNGKYVLSCDDLFGIIVLTDRETGKMDVSFDESGVFQYSAGYGCAVSNNGIVVASTTPEGDDASYYEDGKWHLLPTRDEDTGTCLAHGITPDGSRIIGQVGRVAWSLEESQVMQQPVIWVRNAENTGYDEYIELPYPKKDLLGATPQYVTGVWISEDGKKAAGQVMFSNGGLTAPIVYTEAEDGSWSYKIIHPELLVNSEIEIPEDPGEGPAYPSIEDYISTESLIAYEKAMEEYETYSENEPQPTDFMTDEERAAYEQALQDFYDDMMSNPYPSYDDYMTVDELVAYDDAMNAFNANKPEYPIMENYMTPEELTAYEDANNAYETAYQEWYTKYEAYQDAVYESTAEAPSFLFNTLCLSGNGKYLGLTDYYSDWFSGMAVAIPYVFDLETDEYYELEANEEQILTYVTNDGILLSCTPTDSYMIRKTYVADINVGEYMPIEEYVSSKNPSLYKWMEENMVHTYYTVEYDIVDDEWVEIYTPHENEFCTGTSVTTPDFKYVASWEFNQWEQASDSDDESEEEIYYYSYVLPMDYTSSGIVGVVDRALDVKAYKGGVIELNGKVANVEIYDAFGRRVYNNNTPASTISTGLNNGLYIIKATATNGKTIVKKAAL